MIMHEQHWVRAREAHQEAVDAVVQPHLLRRGRGEAHPVLNFLFTYYNHRPARLRRWHPGIGNVWSAIAPRNTWPCAGTRGQLTASP